jgi:hypothetical protein
MLHELQQLVESDAEVERTFAMIETYKDRLASLI